MSILGGTAGAQIITFIALPAISRLYTPQDFGLLAVITALSMVLGTVSTGRIDLAIPLPEDDAEAVSLVRLALLATISTGIVSLAAVFLRGDQLADSYHLPELAVWLYAVPIVAVLIGSYLTLNQYALRHHRFAAVGRRNLLHSLTTAMGQLTTGGVWHGAGGLVGGFALGYVVGAASLLRGSGLSLASRTQRSRPRLFPILSRYRRFPLLLWPAGLLNVIGLHAPLIVVSAWFGAQAAGLLGMTQRILAIPLTLIGTAVAQVYLAKLARQIHNDPNSAKKMFYRWSKLLLGIGLILGAAVFWFGPQAFASILGESWVDSGRYAQALGAGLVLQLVAAPLSQTLVVLERTWWQFLWDLARLVSLLGGMWVARYLGADVLALMWVIGVINALAYLIMWLLNAHALRRLGDS